MNTTRLRIKRLERLSTDERPLCTHAFTLIVDGQMVQDDRACSCGGERITLVAVHEGEENILETATQVERVLSEAKSV